MPNQPDSKPRPRYKDTLTHWPLCLSATVPSPAPITTSSHSPDRTLLLCCLMDQCHQLQDTAHSNGSTDSCQTPVCGSSPPAPLETRGPCSSGTTLSPSFSPEPWASNRSWSTPSTPNQPRATALLPHSRAATPMSPSNKSPGTTPLIQTFKAASPRLTNLHICIRITTMDSHTPESHRCSMTTPVWSLTDLTVS